MDNNNNRPRPGQSLHRIRPHQDRRQDYLLISGWSRNESNEGWSNGVGIALEWFDEDSSGEWVDLSNQKAAETATFGGSQNNPDSPELVPDCSIANQQNLSSSTVDNSGSAGVAGNCTPETPVPTQGSDYPDPSTSLSYQSGGTKVKTGKILVFVNLGYSKLDESVPSLASNDAEAKLGTPTNGWSVDQVSGKVNVNFFGDINLQGNSLINVSKILGMDGRWSIDESGHLVAKTVEAEEIKATTKLEVGSSQKPTAITVYDEQGKTGCLKIQSVDSGAVQLVAGACGAESLQITVSEPLPTSSSSSASTTPQ